jgi:hypothetical protein
MKIKLLLFFLTGFGILNAQGPYRNLIISEASLGVAPMAYVELTNKGDVTINLSEFELGKVSPWSLPVGYEPGEPLPPIEDWYDVPENQRMMLPDVELAPGQSWVIANVSDWRLEMEKIDPFLYRQRFSPVDMYEIADYHMHYPELPATPPAIDRVDPKYRVLEVWNGRDILYIRHHFINGAGEKDSVVIDRVGRVDIPGGTDKTYSVAGIQGAAYSHHLLRKASVTQGNLDFDSGRGTGPDDSEWMTMRRYSARHPVQWYTGNHGPFMLDENTLRPKAGSGVRVDFNNAVITVPWGVQRDDSLVFQFEKTPGMGWEYRYVPDKNSRRNNHSDSAYLSARTGDTLRVYVAGNTLQWRDFRIEVAAPTAGDNIVVPRKPYIFSTGWYGTGSAYIDNAWFRVTGGAGVDTIKHYYNIPGIDFATRVDTLFKYLERAPLASWEIVWVDGVERADLKHGDILRVTAESGAVKDYFIRVGDYRPGDDAYLAAITWPDIPGQYRDTRGWQGDTIPGFSPTVYTYTIQVPADFDGMPALIATPGDHNARVQVQRAAGYGGTPEERTVKFTVIAENGSTERVYTVLLEKEKLPGHIQPYQAEPLISEFVFREQWNNGFVEIANTGSVPLDLSNYLFANRLSEGPATIFQWELAHHNRYQLYIPGYKWTSGLSEWDIQSLVAEPDDAVNPVVAPGDVFVMGEIRRWIHAWDYESWYNATWWVPGVLDIDFGFMTDNGQPDGHNRVPGNPWGEYPVNPSDNSWGESVARQGKEADFYVFRIVNDSIKLGLKPSTDPADFELVEIFGTGDMNEYDPVGNGAPEISSFVRKPQFVLPNPEPGGSFGSTPEESEWDHIGEEYWVAQGAMWPQQILNITLGLGSHDFIPPTHYMSTVTSLVYRVSPGYLDEEIMGIVTTSVEEFLGNINKMDPGQSLTVISEGDTLGGDDIVNDGDVLSVLSANAENTTLYSLEVSDVWPPPPILTSTQYTIGIDGATGTISGFEYGTTVRAIREGVDVPNGARLTIIDAEDRYVPLQKPMADGIYTDVQVSDLIYFEVVAEDGKTRILYRLMPDSDPSDAFIYSDIYSVCQDLMLIELWPAGTTVGGLLANLISSRGATMRVVDKTLVEREKGTVYRDDRVVVTSQDSSTINLYFLATITPPLPPFYIISSEKYEIDYPSGTIKAVEDESPTVTEFLAEIWFWTALSIDVTDANGNVKEGSELIADGDILRLTSDGMVILSLTIQLTITGIDGPSSGEIRVYPNPGDGTVYMDGLDTGTRIQVYNISGVPVLTRIVQNTSEVLSLEGQPGGLYFIIITGDTGVIGHYKVIIR